MDETYLWSLNFFLFFWLFLTLFYMLFMIPISRNQRIIDTSITSHSHGFDTFEGFEGLRNGNY